MNKNMLKTLSLNLNNNKNLESNTESNQNNEINVDDSDIKTAAKDLVNINDSNKNNVINRDDSDIKLYIKEKIIAKNREFRFIDRIDNNKNNLKYSDDDYEFIRKILIDCDENLDSKLKIDQITKICKSQFDLIKSIKKYYY